MAQFDHEGTDRGAHASNMVNSFLVQVGLAIFVIVLMLVNGG